MSGDYSRIRFDPRKDIASVWMQQGRVQLDSDWNEGMAALDRRLRAESVDTFGVHSVPGRTGVAVVSPQTPNAFKIETNGDNITIGQGRMYVDGLLVENHGGSGAAEFDPVLAELRGRDPLAYDEQPYFLEPPLPEGPYLAYLEVWQRELTYLQYPEMVENAVGVDTTTRWQTVWQVRFLALNEGGNVNCNTRNEDLPQEWQELIRPSAGRMSIKAEGVPPGLDPCELPPSGGYRGLENQLYRIEIHEGGAVGKATFKWSRDNASVASPVVEIVSQTAASTELKLASLGRDAVLRFNTGDWVEILDDRRELNGENGDPALRRGVMRQITVDNARQTIQFSPALPADLIPADEGDTLAARHTRVRRWDQKGATVDSTDGVIKVPSEADKWVELEKGIQVQFKLDPAGGEFRSGDYWVSAARTVDTSIETFTDASPRGIHRHYARLAIVDFREDRPVVSDCRTHWPPACGGCCTITVAPGESIQAAINSLPLAGGCVCLKTGVHIIDEPIRITKSHIILQGEGPGAIVRLNLPSDSPPGAVLEIGNTPDLVSDIVVQRIRFEAIPALKNHSMLFVHNCMHLQVTYCEFITTDTEPTLMGLHLLRVTDITITSNHIQNVLNGIWLYDFRGRMDIDDNFIVGIDTTNGNFGIWVESEEASSCYIENNIIQYFLTGIYLGHGAVGSLIIGNRIYRFPLQIEQEEFFSDIHEYLDTCFYAIDVAASDCKVHHNDISLNSHRWGGIRIIAPGVTVTSNRLQNQSLQFFQSVGIYCTDRDELGYAAEQVTVSDNYLLKLRIGAFISGVNNVTVSSNFIDGQGDVEHGQYGIRLYDCNHSYIRDNILQNLSLYGLYSEDGNYNHIRGNRINQVTIGINLHDESDPKISDNYLYSCSNGILLHPKGDVVLLNNRLVNCGYLLIPSTEVGISGEASIWIFARSPFAIRIDGCEIINTGFNADNVFQATRALGIVIAGILISLQVTNNRIDYNINNMQNISEGEHRAFWFYGVLLPAPTGSALINSNHFRGPGKTALVEFREIFEPFGQFSPVRNMSYSSNICDHLSLPSETDNTDTTVILSGNSMGFIVMGNQIASAKSAPPNNQARRFSLSFKDGMLSTAVCMGNIMTGVIDNNSGNTNVSPTFPNEFNI